MRYQTNIIVHKLQIPVTIVNFNEIKIKVIIQINKKKINASVIECLLVKCPLTQSSFVKMQSLFGY